MPQIVTISVSQQQAPAPATLQQTGAWISQGATVTTALTTSLITQLSDFTPLMMGARAITSMVLTSGVVTVTTTAPHGFTTGDTLLLSIAGTTPTAYSGTFLCTVTGASAFTYPLAGTPGAVTVQGMYTPEDVAELLAMILTHFSQGSAVSAYILELGPGNANDGVAALGGYLAANLNAKYVPGPNGAFNGYIYDFVVPRTWDANASFIALGALYSSTTSRVYFETTTTLATYSAYPITSKAFKLLIESPNMGIYTSNVLTAASTTSGVATATTTTAHGVVPGNWFQIAGVTPIAYNGWALALPGTTGTSLVWSLPSNPGSATAFGTLLPNYYANAGIPSTEFSAAAFMYPILHYRPGSTNKVPPYNYTFLYGVTPFPSRGLQSLLVTLKNAAVSVVGTGAEGGISTSIISGGMTMDGRQFNYWYATDWCAINGDLALANAVINGSNNPINPLYYNQPGIDRLEAVLAGVFDNANRFGLSLWPTVQLQLDGPDLIAALGQPASVNTLNQTTVINAVPFVKYSVENPGDYRLGNYGGFSVQFTPQLGFTTIVVNFVVSDFVITPN